MFHPRKYESLMIDEQKNKEIVTVFFVGERR